MDDFDLSYQRLTIDCPNCHFSLDILVKQVVAEETIICPGCLQEIKLIDEDSSTKNMGRKINSAFEDLSNSLSKFRR
jgi:peptide subunit release factor 1 (eRF1)